MMFSVQEMNKSIKHFNNNNNNSNNNNNENKNVNKTNYILYKELKKNICRSKGNIKNTSK
jgi:hypothetical protein